jgi:hypothetical protein
MDPQVTPDVPGPVGQALSQQELRRPERPRGQDHRPRADLVAAPAVGAGLDAGGAAALHEQALDAGAGSDPGAGRSRARQLGHMHRLLGVDRAPGRAGPATTNAPGVARDRTVGRPQRVRARAAELGVAPRGSGVDGRDVEGPLDGLELRLEVGRPGDPVLIAPAR